jgi:heme/copper-type cytochrome/quinol oxidase subunit 2
MGLTRRRVGLLLLGAATFLAAPLVVRLVAQPGGSGSPERAPRQDQPPNRHEFSLVAHDFQFSPDRIEVSQDDLVKVTIRSDDVAYSFTIDEYRILRRVPAGGSTTFEFRADRPGTFRFYSNLTGEAGHSRMQGQLVVHPR